MDIYAHVGTNNLKEDVRQSGSHCSWYETEYNIDIVSYWIFPIFDSKGNVSAVFRIMNKKLDRGKEFWDYKERATLLEVARWFETYGDASINMLLHEEGYSDKENNKIYEQLEISKWFDKMFFVKIMRHLQSLAHKKIEYHSVEVCIAVLKKDIIKRFLSNPKSLMNPMQSSSLNIGDTVDIDSLNKISLLYKTMNPFQRRIQIQPCGETV